MFRPSVLFFPLAALAIAFPCAAKAKGELVNNTGGPIWLTIANGTGKVTLKGADLWKDLKTNKKLRVEDGDRLQFEVNAKKGDDGMIVLDEKGNEMPLTATGIIASRKWKIKGDSPVYTAADSGGTTPVITLKAKAE